MRVQTKFYLFIFLSTVIMSAVFSFGASYAIRDYTINSEREHGQIGAEIVRKEMLLRLMQNNIIREQIVGLLQRQIPDVRQIEIVRGPNVIKQFGGSSRPLSDDESRALEEKRPVENYIENDEGVQFEYIAPLYAEKTAERDCTQCHDVSPGTPMGILNIHYDLTKMRESQHQANMLIVVVLLFFAIVLAYFLKILLIPIARSTESIQKVVEKARRGDFTGRQDVRGNDEIAQVGRMTNELMATLEKSFGDIIDEVGKVQTYRLANNDGNLLDHTVNVVRSMVASTQFKHTIEDDRDLDDVYVRISHILKSEFGLRRFSFYDVNTETGQLRTVFVEGLEKSDDMWCLPSIKTDETLCRARRTAQVITSTDDEMICPAFAGNDIQNEQKLYHVCIPVILSGRSDGILQIIYSNSERKQVERSIPYIRTYLSDAAPVIESKRLMKILKESTLRDPLTGLHNRRFLEEYQGKLVALSERQEMKSQLIMCDLDHFKATNDNYGHQTGDKVLMEAAAVLTSSVRKSDLVIRYGGEEFLIILLNASQALTVADKICKALAAKEFHAGGETFGQTISLGISAYPEDSADFLECISFADIALYQAKEQGRNRFVVYQKGMKGEAAPEENPPD